MGTRVSTPAEVAGVTCPKEAGKMPKTDPCTGCRFFPSCAAAALGLKEVYSS